MHRYRKATELSVDLTNPFAGDRLGRRPLADNLTQLVSTLTQPVVLALDGPWGSGKTTFARMWRPVLEHEGHSVIHFNAWDNDFADDPLFALMATVETQLSPEPEGGGEAWETAKRMAARFSRAVAPLALRIAARAILGTSELESLTALPDGSADDVSEFANAAAEEQIRRHAEAARTQKAFRNALTEFASRITQRIDGKTRSVVVIVDELDRCKPLFALNMLERIKHFFSVQGIVFVLVLDKTQLGHSIRAVYGSGLDADNYLRRFIDLTIELPEPNAIEFVRYLYGHFGISELQPLEQSELTTVTMAALFDAFRIRLREQEQLLAELAVAARVVGRSAYAALELLSVLVVLRVINRDLYLRYARGYARAEEVLAFLKSVPAMGSVLAEYNMPLEAILEGYSLFPGDLEAAIQRTGDEYNAPNVSYDQKQRARRKGALLARTSTPPEGLRRVILPALTFASAATEV